VPQDTDDAAEEEGGEQTEGDDFFLPGHGRNGLLSGKLSGGGGGGGSGVPCDGGAAFEMEA
jgi:hypothetical protein